MKYVMALDQGTTSSRAIIFNEKLEIVSMAQQTFRQYYPNAGWVEHDPEEIYSGICGCMAEALNKVGLRGRDIAAVGITNQRETTVVWDRETGRPVYNAIVWQCRRTADICSALKEKGLAEHIRKTTGLVVDAYFSGTKIKWILDHTEGARELAEEGRLLFGTIDSWLIWKLSGGRAHVTDVTNASRTMLFDIRRLDWDPVLLRELRIPRTMLPKVLPSSAHFADMQWDGSSVPITGVAGDQQAALFGQCCFEAGEAKNTYGTGCFLLMNTGTQAVESSHGLLTTLAASTDGKVRYALEGSVFVGGAVMQWLRDEMHLLEDAGDASRLAKKVPDNGGVYLVPAFTGLGAPYWDMYARGTIVGITRGTKPEHLIRAAEESIAYQTADLLRAMEKDLGQKISRLKVDGGACRDDFLMQFQADIMDAEVDRPVVRETTAMGAAALAGLAAGVWADAEMLRGLRTPQTVFAPKMEKEERMRLRRNWKKAVGRSTDWDEH